MAAHSDMLLTFCANWYMAVGILMPNSRDMPTEMAHAFVASSCVVVLSFDLVDLSVVIAAHLRIALARGTSAACHPPPGLRQPSAPRPSPSACSTGSRTP